jgi:hypothetical protein
MTSTTAGRAERPKKRRKNRIERGRDSRLGRREPRRSWQRLRCGWIDEGGVDDRIGGGDGSRGSTGPEGTTRPVRSDVDAGGAWEGGTTGTGCRRGMRRGSWAETGVAAKWSKRALIEENVALRDELTRPVIAVEVAVSKLNGVGASAD